MNKHLQLLLLFIFFTIPFFSKGQAINVVTQSPSNATNVVLNTFLAPSGVMPGSVQNVTFTGVPGAFATYTTPTGNSAIGFNEGLILSTDNCNYIPNPAIQQISGTSTGPGDPQLQYIATATTQDAAVLQFDFQPLTDTLKFRYVFGSEEYPEYVCSQFNDVFGFFITGPNPSGPDYNNYNIARIPGTNLPVSINSINSGSPGSNSGSGTCSIAGQSLAYASLYNNNLNGVTIIFDGMTNVLEARIPVKICGTYHIKLAVANCSDNVFDSGVFLEAHSFGGGYGSVTANGGTPLSANSSMLCIGDTIILSGSNAVAYQWIAFGDTLQSIHITQPGMYSLYVHNYDGSCFQISVPYQVIADSSCFAAIIEIHKPDLFEIAPNPFNNKIAIHLNKTYPMESIIRIQTLSGKLIKTVLMQPFADNISLSLQDLPKGIYLLEVNNQGGNMIKRIVRD